MPQYSQHDPSTKPLRRRLTPSARREMIMNAAIKLFAHQGLARTTTRQIAHEAGIAEGTIYKYFASKDDILQAFFEHEIFQALPALLAEEAHDEIGLLQVLARNRLALWARHRDLLKAIAGEALVNPQLAERCVTLLVPVMDLLERHITGCTEAGTFRRLDSRTAVRGLLGMLMVNFLWNSHATAQGSGMTIDALAAEVVTLFWQGVRAEPEEGQDA
jgi:AcrR family transcriptional regulator